MTLTDRTRTARPRRAHRARETRSPGLLDRVIDLHRLEAPDGAELAPYLADPEPEVRAAALRVLGRAVRRGGEPGDRATGDALARALSDEDRDVRRLAARLLHGLAEVSLGADGVAALHRAVHRAPDAQARAAAATVLAKLVGAAAELYAQGLQDDEVQIRVQAVIGLVALRAADETAQAADDPSRAVRVAVADGLARLAEPVPGDPAPGIAVGALDALGHLLDDHDPVVRMAALDASAGLGVPEPLDVRVVAATAHRSWQVRRRAVLALGSADPDVAVPALRRALRDGIVDVRRAAVQSLEQWAGEIPDAVTALTETLGDPDPGVRTQARWALA
ncbi:HEAT repeat domain-containing protein [Actinomadura atramentaria]|uniref:HEAT repeat domain-containing protein n=1 Tax=Actinomadura atramentaria TaxID=1990 RepID=UPI00037C8104|nr:HEAT repeat domain-containing protein [Actinomadura atramentaria]